MGRDWIFFDLLPAQQSCRTGLDLARCRRKGFCGSILDYINFVVKRNLAWMMLIMQPEVVTPAIVEPVREKVMPHGLYTDEKRTVDLLHAFIDERGLTP